MSDDNEIHVSDEAKQKVLDAMKAESAKKKVLEALKKNGSLEEAVAVRALRNMMKD